MVYTEVQVKNNKKYYYRTLSIREGKKFRKFRIYLGSDLSKRELSQKEQEANLIIQSQSGKERKINSEIAMGEILRTKWIVHHNRSSLISMLTGGSLFDVFNTGFFPLFGDSHNQLLMVYNKGKTMVGYPEKKVEKIGKIAFNQLFVDPKIMEKYHKIFDSKSKELLVFLKKKSAQKLSEREIVRAYSKYCKLYKDSCIWGEPFPSAVYEELTTYLENLLKSAVSDEKKRLALFTLLITPRDYSFISREEKELNEIVLEIKKDKDAVSLFSKNLYSILDEIKKYPEVYLPVVTHQKRYFWISYDYFGKPLDISFFVKRIKEKLTFRSEQQIMNLNEIIQKQDKEFEKLFKRGAITKKDYELFISAQQATLLMDYKKEMFSKAHYYVNLILKQAAEIVGIPLETLIFAHKDELPSVLSGKIKRNGLLKRKEKSAFYFNKTGICVFTSKDVDAITDYLESGKKQTIKEISGRCASQGTVIGRIRIVRSLNQINSIRRGEILVTGMTTPEYLVAMKKASAIITDEGGITCHAAIVSRELGIPCIVGTRNATSILNDGDLVELHAGNGVIKILKSER